MFRGFFRMPDFLRRDECFQWGKPRFLNVTSHEYRNVGIPDNWLISQIFTSIQRCGLKYTIFFKTYKQCLKTVFTGIGLLTRDNKKSVYERQGGKYFGLDRQQQNALNLNPQDLNFKLGSDPKQQIQHVM